MNNVVYVDVLLVVNFVIDYLLLLASGHLAGRTLGRGRVALSALFGALTTLVIFFPRLPFGMLTLYRLGTAVLMVLMAFPWRGGRQLLRDVFVFFTSSFLLSGVMTAVWVQFAPRGMLTFNGVVYFNISMITLLLTTVAAYLVIWIFGRIFKARRPEKNRIRVQLLLGGKPVELWAIEDTGNRLREPFSGTPVAVCSLRELMGVLPVPLIEGVLTGSFDSCHTLEPCWQPRMVPYRTVDGAGMLAAIRPQELRFYQDGEAYLAEEVYLAISPKPVGDGDYQMLLSSELLHFSYRRCSP